MTEGTTRDFAELPALKQKAVLLKSHGNTHAAIARRLSAEFQSSTTKKTVDGWFETDGLLWRPYMNLNEKLADQALAEAHQLVRTYAGEAVQTLRELSRPPHPATVRVSASRALAGVLLRNPEVAAKKPPQSPLDELINKEIADIMRSTQVQGE